MNVIMSVLVAWLCLVNEIAIAASFPCGSSSFVDSYGSLPTAPQYPVTQYVENGLSIDSLVQSHWSEIVTLARPEILTTIDASQSNCPHMQSGLKNWHDPATWPGNVVPTGSNVNIPPSSKILVSSCSINPSTVFGTITVPVGSELIFGDADIIVQAAGFRVQGALRIGSPTCRIRSKISITLVGSRTAQSLPTNEWVKGIYVTGEIDVHGVRFSPTWTRLARTLSPGNNVILVQDLVNWQPGQQIVVTTTELKDTRDYHRNEVFTISAVQKYTQSISAIFVTTPAQYKHFGGREYQAEVGLLTRNILIQGDATGSAPTDGTDFVCRDPAPGNSTYPCPDRYLTGFGAHVMVAGSKGRFSGLEVYRGGQTNVIARYPIHFHMMGSVSSDDAFVIDSSVHESYFRCYAVHGTSGVLVRENVAYDAIGHCYFIEDGVEENSTFAYNMGALVHTLGPVVNPSLGVQANGGGNFWSQELSYIDESATLILPSDLSASVFYITNPANYFIGNAASGGWAGYGFPALRTPVKLHQFTNNGTTPMARPLLQFKGNSAHSTGFFWGSAGGIYVGGELFHKYANGPLTYTAGRVVSATRDTCAVDPKSSGGWCPAQSRLWQTFEDTKVFLVNGRGIQHWGNRAVINRFEIWDTGLSMNVFGNVLLKDGLTVCRSLNHQPSFLSGCPTRPVTIPNNPSNSYNCNTRDRYFWQAGSAFQFYDVGQRHLLTNVEYRHCNWPMFRPCYYNCQGGTIFTLLSHSSQFVPELMQVTKQITCTNCTDSPRWKFSTALVPEDGPTISGRIQSWYDLDGTVAGTGRRTMLGSARAGNWWRYNDQCFLKDEMHVCPLLSSQDSSSSLVLRGVHPNETNIGNTQCLNGAETIPKNCPIVGQATSFGFKEGESSLDIGMNAKLTGPLVGFSGGWFIRLRPMGLDSGMPRQIQIDSIQVYPSDYLLLAFPYPASTTFSIRALAASWCSPQWYECSKNFTMVDTLDEVRFGDGTKYFFKDNTLFIRAVIQAEGSFGRKGDAWALPADPPSFSREGMTLMDASSQFRIVISASGCGGSQVTQTFSYCDPATTVKVPGALGPVPLCTFPKPDYKLRCAFTQTHIELIVEFCVFFAMCAILYGRTPVLKPLRMVVERVLLAPLVGMGKSKRGWSDSKALAVASCFVMLLGFAALICCADTVAMQVACVLFGLGLVIALVKSRTVEFASPIRSWDRNTKLLLACFAFHFFLIGIAFVLTYLSDFQGGVRLYAMLPAVLLVLHPLWTTIAAVTSRESVPTKALVSSPDGDAAKASGKRGSGSSSGASAVSLPNLTVYKSVNGMSMFMHLIGLGLAASGMYFAFVVATL